MKTFAEKVIDFNRNLQFNDKLPAGISIMNPFKEGMEATKVSTLFYRKYYDDYEQRFFILGINPGRFGAGLTGIPFTDPKRLLEQCHIAYEGKMTHEPSSVFIYDMITAYGGPEAFYAKFYIGAVCPLGFVLNKSNGRPVNYNYYDSNELTAAVKPFIVANIKKQIKMGVATERCFCFGTGKNEQFLRQLNSEYHFFQHIVALEHPRFIMQYKSKTKQEYVNKYLTAFQMNN